MNFDHSSDIAGQARSNHARTIELHVAETPENLESTVRGIVAELDPDMTVLRITSFGEQLRERFNQERLMAWLTSIFGVLALLLAAIGLYGVTSYGSSAAPVKSEYASPSEPTKGM